MAEVATSVLHNVRQRPQQRQCLHQPWSPTELKQSKIASLARVSRFNPASTPPIWADS
jgi:hypothetical protein